MDIYQRRRLTAVGVLVTFISVIAIAAGSGGGGDETTPVTTTGLTGASGATGAQGALTKPDFIAQADSICAEANSAIAGATGVGTAVPDPGVKIRQKEYNQLSSLQAPAQGSANAKQLVNAYKQLLAAVKKRELANKRADTTAQADAGTQIGDVTATIQTAGDAYGFKTCNSLDTTSSSSGSNSGTADAGASNGTAAPSSDTGAVTPSTDTVTPSTDTVTPNAPPADTAPTDDGSGSSGGVTP
ncbi:hypothetical protein BH10ACT11_BH10ACT11_02080 [soil metagenome]